MDIQVEMTTAPIPRSVTSAGRGQVGAWVEFAGIVRDEENGNAISALEYEAYEEMAIRVMRELLTELGASHRCISANVIHRIGVIPVGQTAIWIGVEAAHRKEALALVSEFMDRLRC